MTNFQNLDENKHRQFTDEELRLIRQLQVELQKGVQNYLDGKGIPLEEAKAELDL